MSGAVALLEFVFKVLIVLGRPPVAAPDKALFCKELVGQVVLVDFIRNVSAVLTVKSPLLCRLRGNNP